MNKLAIIFIILFSLQSFAQADWKKETASTFSIMYPNHWELRESETEHEITVTGATPDEFKESKEFVGTTLYISGEDSRFNSLEEAKLAYREKIMNVEFLKKVSIFKEEQIKLDGIDAIEIHFKCKIQGIPTKCRMILFNHNNTYYEVSVTYDSRLPQDLINEAFKVMETFEVK